ncbi:thioredoxin domain-containing protein [Mesonia maritima]|uniref:Spermatogenesis-associated protein 20-like TRX domain-containing protein n=1 Tax=Mesonia maritima TaxID=1793873 RepID=A0ABU1K6I0_9FLAO|nr:thioredoxin domain-containing protein [Mesonia maritima]MDR6300193.1 hypothetical protein [Mesonia maritima]
MKNLTNNLAKESSPYLLQHANNPVHWQAWDKNLLNQKKLLLISIGYSACHWCHVMEKECFEDNEVASVMNENFINIKIDREERPDLDHVYMQALQAMTGRGGWPLNVVALPDGRPIWASTYLPKKNWMGTLFQLKDLYKSAPEKMYEYAEKLEKGLQQLNIIDPSNEKEEFSTSFIDEVLKKWRENFDHLHGGMKGAPKFLMPNNYHFLLRYGAQLQHKEIVEFVEFSLTKMIYGGIYDTLGGGFSRYSVDERWHIPHFEKMLYDNAQMISLLSDAYLVTKNPLFKETAIKTLAFLEEEFHAEENGFYSALDADSVDEKNQSKEGAFYTWKKKELEEILQDDFQIFAEYYNVNHTGYWEEGNYVFIRTKSAEEIAEQFSTTTRELEKIISRCKKKLISVRKKKAKPGLDTKILTSWNALTITAYCDAYRVFQNEKYIEIAENTLNFLWENRFKNGTITRSFKKNNEEISGCLDDYAFLIEACLKFYENTFQEKWISRAKTLTDYCLSYFFDEDKNVFFYTSSKEDGLFIKTIETEDNVIPSSNSAMAKNLGQLSKIYRNKEYEKISKTLLKNIQPRINEYPMGYSNWLMLFMNYSSSTFELLFSGENFKENLKSIHKHYLPQLLKVGKNKNISEKLPILKYNEDSQKNSLLLCTEDRCFLPTDSLKIVLKSIRNTEH